MTTGTTSHATLTTCRVTGVTGLDYFGARYFSGAQGRFTSPDPDNFGANVHDPQSWNAYGYARNNPLVYTDPTGLKYRLCDTEGNCTEDYSDEDFRKYFGLSGSSGEITDKAGNLIGTFEHLSEDPRISPFDFPGQWFAGFVDLFINEKPSGAARMAYAYAGSFTEGAVAGAVITSGSGAIARNLPFKDASLMQRVGQALEDIAQGTRRYARDGIVFQNREGLLPAKPAGYYREYTVQPSVGTTGRGAERIVVGQGGEIYYTPNHYGSFARIR